MLEILAIPAIIAGAAFIPKRKMSDDKKIEQIFINRKVCFKSGESLKYPKLKRKVEGDTHTTYLYSLPLGMPLEALESLIPAMSEGLNKEVEMELDGLLKVSVYSTKLANWNYDESLIQPSKWEVPIGKNHQGIVYHDFDKYPHLLNGGVTRFGKTVFMKEVFHTLLMNNPQDVEFYILDLKAGLEFFKFSGLPQVKKVACDVFESAETLYDITEKLKRREELFRNNGYSNIVDTPLKKRTFIIVDEGAELSPNIVKTKEAKKHAEFCQAALSEIARIGGGLGYRLIYATQYPTKEAVPMQVKMNIVARMSFICASQVASRVLLDDTGAEDLPAIPGRAIYLIEKKRTVQVPYIDDKMMFQMMEERKDELTNRKPVTDDRPVGHGENQTPTAHT